MAALSAQVNVRIPEEEYRMLMEAASLRGLTVGVFLRRAGLRVAEAELQRPTPRNGTPAVGRVPPPTPVPAGRPITATPSDDWRAKLAAKASESRSTDQTTPNGRRSPVASDPGGETGAPGCAACLEPDNRALVHSYSALCVAEPKAKTAGMHPNRSQDTAPTSKDAVVADLKEKVAAVVSNGAGLQGSGTSEDPAPPAQCEHPKAKAVVGASGVAVKVCPDCGDRGL